MLDGPLGGAAFNNEFGRPNLAGYFRSFELAEGEGLARAYDKPIMLAGGLGAIDRIQVEKIRLQEGDAVIVPVSYTHLDVYKRQLHHRPGHP